MQPPAPGSLEDLYNKFIQATSTFLQGANDADMDFATEKLDHHRFLYDKKVEDVRWCNCYFINNSWFKYFVGR